MATIWKAVLLSKDIQEIAVPRGAEILCAREQNEQMCIWYRCDPAAPLAPRTIVICGTGHTAPEETEARYLGTCALMGGSLQFHVFERV